MRPLRFQIPGIAFYPRHYISHALIVVSAIVAIIGFIFPWLVSYFGLHAIGVNSYTAPFILGQIILYQFLHGSLIHIFLNAYFLYQAGPEVESRMNRSEFISFFLGNTIFVALALWFLSPGLTIGISGFCMALLSYLYMDLQATRHPMANQVLTMLMINV
jgi:membrane associated rhomboid family serine protease